MDQLAQSSEQRIETHLSKSLLSNANTAAGLEAGRAALAPPFTALYSLHMHKSQIPVLDAQGLMDAVNMKINHCGGKWSVTV